MFKIHFLEEMYSVNENSRCGHMPEFRLLFFLLLIGSLKAVLDLSPTAADEIIDNLRSHIFVDHRHVLQGTKPASCDSLAGPNCDPVSSSGLSSGVIPDEYLSGLQIDFSVLHQALPVDLWKFNYTNVLPENYALPPPSNLVMTDFAEGGRITSRYSLTLPTGKGLAKLEGRWLLEDTVSMETYLPAYITFSEPVMVKKLWAELTAPPDLDPRVKSVVIIAFRLGTDTVWTSEAVMDPGFTLDLTSRGSDGHGPFRACDRIVLFSTVRGLKIVSIEFENVEEQVLVPTLLLVPGKDGNLMFKSERVDAGAIANGQIVSIKDAVQKGLRLGFPNRTSTSKSEALAALIAKDIGMIVPIDEVFKAVKTGELKVPHELKKAILKHEKDYKRIAQGVAKRALEGILSPTDEAGPESSTSKRATDEDEKKLQGISDLFLAALMHL